jgi:hypothetical protein
MDNDMTDKKFQFHKVAVHGVPRSGTTWIGEIINSSPHTAYRYQPLFSYAHKDFLTASSATSEINEFFKRLLECEDEFTNQTAKRKAGDFPVFKKDYVSHVVYKEVRYVNILFNMMRKTDDVVLVAVIRNPLSVTNSWLRAPREFRRDLGWSEMEEWRYALKKNLNRPEEYHGYEKWKESANIFLQLKKAFPGRVYIQKYCDLLMRPVSESKKLFDFIGLEFSEQTRRFLSDSAATEREDSYAVFRKNQSDSKWKDQLDTAIAQEILDDLEGTNLEIFV